MSSVTSSSSSVNKDNNKQYKKQKVETSPNTTIDLTQDVVVFPLSIIKRDNPTFYSYDPRGVGFADYLPINYCDGCRCPIQYCANTVFTNMLYKHVMCIIHKQGYEDFDEDSDITEEISSVYTSMVHNKMLWNNISFNSCDTEAYVRLPTCMQPYQLLQKIQGRIEVEKEADADEVWSSSLDLSVDELAKVFVPTGHPNEPVTLLDSDEEESVDLEDKYKLRKERREYLDRLSPPDVSERFKRIREMTRAPK